MAAKPTWPPRAPAELADSGKRLWRSIVADDQDLVLNAVELAQLGPACKLSDRIAVLEAALADEQLRSTGSTGQPVLNPLLAEARMHTQLVTQTLSRLKLDIPEEKPMAAGGNGNRFRAAAMARWGMGVLDAASSAAQHRLAPEASTTTTPQLASRTSEPLRNRRCGRESAIEPFPGPIPG